MTKDEEIALAKGNAPRTNFMTQKQQLETLLKSFGVGFRSEEKSVLLDDLCNKVETLGSFMYCSFNFDADGNISNVDIGE